ELPATDTEPARVPPRRLREERGDLPLLRRLVEGEVLFVGDDLRGQRREPIGHDVVRPLPRPAPRAHRHFSSPVRGQRGSPCRALARSMSRSPGTLSASGANRPPTATPPGSGP